VRLPEQRCGYEHSPVARLDLGRGLHAGLPLLPPFQTAVVQFSLPPLQFINPSTSNVYVCCGLDIIMRRRDRQYRHSPMPPGSYIHLVKLLPTSTHGSICPELQVFTLEDAPPFDALSYKWSDPSVSCEIRCHGYRMFVTQNLFDFLSYQRSQEPCLLWIDAISLDMSNIRERSRTVPKITQIYSAAKRIVCWTESGNMGSLRTFLSSTPTARLCNDDLMHWFSTTNRYHTAHRITDRVALRPDIKVRRLDRRIWQDVESFLDQVYFKR